MSTEVKTTTCYMCACRCGIRVPYLPPRSAPQVARAQARENAPSLSERVAGWVNNLVER